MTKYQILLLAAETDEHKQGFYHSHHLWLTYAILRKYIYVSYVSRLSIIFKS